MRVHNSGRSSSFRQLLCQAGLFPRLFLGTFPAQLREAFIGLPLLSDEPLLNLPFHLDNCAQNVLCHAAPRQVALPGRLYQKTA